MCPHHVRTSVSARIASVSPCSGWSSVAVRTCTSSPSSVDQPGGDRRVHALGVDRAHRLVATLVDVLPPHRYSYHRAPITSKEHTAGGGHRRGLGRTPARRRLRQATRRGARRDRRAGGARADRAGRAPRRRAPRRPLGGAARGRHAGRGQRRRADLPARADHHRRAGARAARAVARSRSRARSRRPRRWSTRPRAAGRVLDVAFNHRRRGDIETLKRVVDVRAARPDLLRQGVVAAADRDPDRSGAGSPTSSRRAAGRCWTSACTCSTTRCTCSGSRR